MCGLSGSGKTTFAKKLEGYNFQRLSIDEEIWNNYGKFGIDYTEKEYKKLSSLAEKALLIQFLSLLKSKRNIVVDFSFWQKEKRNKFKQIVETNYGKWFLIYMNPSISVIKARLKIRNKNFEANAAFPITNSILNKYLSSFQIPEQENQFEITSNNVD
ncbi:ATP-binding protein [Chitinophaga sp. 212800010-3]|uniref:AAA family ATPase n=1 Tax=unclassified Chitinophaga TaxID=2619133 RepID=UPI002DF34685|nr:ATP-binding protein [Chitinophaga sp. 212800010-3]